MNKHDNNSLQHEWVYREYVNREDLIIHAAFAPEMDFYNAVATGNEKEVRKYLKEDFLKKEGLGKLSENTLRNGKYHFTITAALVARECIKSGMSIEEAYSMSDFFIQKADNAKSTSEITEIHDEMCIDYTRKMLRLKRSTIYSKPIVDSVNYIYSHLHTKITLENLVNEVHLSPAYLSRLFKSETGQTLSSYIAYQRIETAKRMLEFSNYTPGQIALILAYPSQSYFTECFRKATGVTPKKWRG